MREKLRHVGEKEKIQCFIGILEGENRENWEQAAFDYQETKNLCKKATTTKKPRQISKLMNALLNNKSQCENIIKQKIFKTEG